MGAWNDRDKRNEYRGDVWYEEWRSGLPEESVSDERIEGGYYDGTPPASLVRQELQRQQEREAAARCEQERLEQAQYEEFRWREEQERYEYYREEPGAGEDN